MGANRSRGNNANTNCDRGTDEQSALADMGTCGHSDPCCHIFRCLETFKLQENWINYRTICETLRKEIHYYNAGIGEYEHTDNKKKMFVQRVEAIISRENTLWLEHTDINRKRIAINKQVFVGTVN